ALVVVARRPGRRRDGLVRLLDRRHEPGDVDLVEARLRAGRTLPATRNLPGLAAGAGTVHPILRDAVGARADGLRLGSTARARNSRRADRMERAPARCAGVARPARGRSADGARRVTMARSRPPRFAVPAVRTH